MIPEPPETSRPPADGPAPRRVYVPSLSEAPAGSIVKLQEREVHHLVRVLRMASGARLEAFDDAGKVAHGELFLEAAGAFIRLLEAPGLPTRHAEDKLTVYSALPKGSRADWMVEKLCELGVWALVPLLTERSVVAPGAGKLQRFARIAREAAAQSRRFGVLAVAQPAPLAEALEAFARSGEAGALLATERAGRSLAELVVQNIFIGPEGGWSARELEAMTAAGLEPARLTDSILRTETAAVCAASVLRARQGPTLR